MSITPSRRTHTIADQEWVIDASTPVALADVSAVVTEATAEAQQQPTAATVWMRPDGNTIVVGYTTETTA